MNVVGARDYWPEEWPDWPSDPKARKAVAGLFNLGLSVLNAPACLRESRLEQANNKATKFWFQMSLEEQEKIGALVALWEKHALVQQNICWREAKDGIDAVDHLYQDWCSAGKQMDGVQERAGRAGLASLEYFKCRVERFRILQDERDEFGEYHNFPDYSKLREQWYSRNPITLPVPWPWDEMIGLCKQYEDNGQEARGRRAGVRLGITGIVLTSVVGAVGIVVTLLADKF